MKDCYECRYADRNEKDCHALPKTPVFIQFGQYSDYSKNGMKLVSQGQTGQGCSLFAGKEKQ